MLNRAAELRARRAAGEGGFTLIELLVVVVIIGILIAIAIPLYLTYKQGANDKAAQSDLRATIPLLQQCTNDNSTYPSAFSAGSFTVDAGQTCASPKLSTGTTFTYAVDSASKNYTTWATNTGGSGKTYCYASAAGGSVAVLKNSTVGTYADAC